MNALRSTLLAGATAALILSCNGAGSHSAPTASTKGASPDVVVAKVDGRSITLGELDAHSANELYKKREELLNQWIVGDVVKAEATKHGQTEEQYFEQAVPVPSEDEVKKFYDENAARRPPGSPAMPPLESVKSQIEQRLRQEKGSAFIEQLKKQHNVELMLPRPRIQVATTGPSRGPESAKVTIVEFSDFECPYCGKAYETVEELMKDYPGKIRLVYRQYPLPFHAHAQKAAEASMCANEQGKFWDMYSTLFKNQHALEVDKLHEYAKSAGLDEAKFTQCLDAGKFASQIKQDQEAGSEAGVTGTPAFFVNGVFLNGALPIEDFKKVIDGELAGS